MLSGIQFKDHEFIIYIPVGVQTNKIYKPGNVPASNVVAHFTLLMVD